MENITMDKEDIEIAKRVSNMSIFEICEEYERIIKSLCEISDYWKKLYEKLKEEKKC